MKKIKIAAGVAALGIAALPIAGVFAETNTTTSIDEVQITILSACALEAGGTADADGKTWNNTVIVSGNAIPGNVYKSPSSGEGLDNEITITCNSASGNWALSAIGAGTGDDITSMTSEGDASIDTGTATTGATSTWAFRLNTTGSNQTISSEYNDTDTYYEIPGEEIVVATGSTSTSENSYSTIIPEYQVYVAPTQAAGTYTGVVQYTLTSPAA